MRQNFIFILFLNLFFALSEGVTEAQNSLSFNLHNSLVEEYLTQSSTSYGSNIGRTGVSILDYKKDEAALHYIRAVGHENEYQKSNWAEQPSPVCLEGLQGKKIVLSASPSFAKKSEFAIDKNGGVSIYNLVPQTVYWYRTFDSSSRIVSEGVFKTQGQLRMIRVENALNIRDLGGWKCVDGSHIAYEKLYRGGTLDGNHDDNLLEGRERMPISAEDAEMLADIVGIKAEEDLRGPDYKMASSLIPGAVYDNFSSEVYISFLDKSEKYNQIQRSLNFIVNNLINNKPVFFHCEWGADRTGCLAFIIGALCGVREDELVKDWELTTFSNYYDYKIISDGDGSKMRQMIVMLFSNAYGGTSTSLQSQVTTWLKDKVYKSKVSGGLSAETVINTLKQKLIVSDTASPKLIKDWSQKSQNYTYSVVTDTQNDHNSTQNVKVLSSGKEDKNDMFCATGFIDCKNYTRLLVGVKCNIVAVCYNSKKEKIGAITNSDIADGAVIIGNAEYTLPTGTKYIRFNMPKNSGWSAVLSNQSYL